MQVNGVRTTGIYCRATCSAQPKRENVGTYRSTIAAEAAGYRPCLRCRPDRGPQLDLASSAPGPVATALTLISDGFLDRATEAALARRVGYSERQLRRLFQDHVGATPSFIAASRRAHFARLLLDETDLQLAHVATAAGFAGSRQMSRAVTKTFGFPPGTLRRKRRSGPSHRLDGGITLDVPIEPEIDVQAFLGHLQARTIPTVESVRDGRYRRTTTTCGHPGVLEATPEADRLLVALHTPTYNSLIDDVARLKRLIGVDRDHEPAVRQLSEDLLLSSLVELRPGLRVPGGWDRFETAVRIMVGQQVSVAGATTITGRIASEFGMPLALDAEDDLSRTFPTPETLARADLKGLGMPHRRADNISSFARAVHDGDVVLHDDGDIDEICDRFEVLPGIGPWTSHMFALRVLGHPDAFPASDLGLRTAVGRLLGIERASAEQTAEAAERWRPFRSLAAQHLWASLSD